MEIKWVDLYNKSDSRGSLLVAEAQKNIPFDMKRVYCLYGMNAEPRGFHAHKALQQVVICLSGSCRFSLDDGEMQETIELSVNGKGLFIDKMLWHEMREFTPDCVLMILASDWYDEGDYIRDYSVFKKMVNL